MSVKASVLGFNKLLGEDKALGQDNMIGWKKKDDMPVWCWEEGLGGCAGEL